MYILEDLKELLTIYIMSAFGGLVRVFREDSSINEIQNLVEVIRGVKSEIFVYMDSQLELQTGW